MFFDVLFWFWCFLMFCSLLFWLFLFIAFLFLYYLVCPGVVDTGTSIIAGILIWKIRFKKKEKERKKETNTHTHTHKPTNKHKHQDHLTSWILSSQQSEMLNQIVQTLIHFQQFHSIWREIFLTFHHP